MADVLRIDTRRADAENDVDATQGLWTAVDVAAYLKCSRALVYKLVKHQKLAVTQVNSLLRFQPELVRAYALGSTRPASPLTLVPRGDD